MAYTTLISAEKLHEMMLRDYPLMIFDCSFDLTDLAAGDRMFEELRIAGAVRADLNRNLSATSGAQRASGGRHPLPTREDFAAWLAGIGFKSNMQAVVYERQGAATCARMWWMLRWAGHEEVAVLDGGLAAWQAAGGPVAQGKPASRAVNRGDFKVGKPLARLVTTPDVQKHLRQPDMTLIDARAPARYRGETEPFDPVAGHIPGAHNRPYTENFRPDGKFKSATQLRDEFEKMLNGRQQYSVVVHYCGSGVSAIPNLLAQEIAGLGRSSLYAGSWSEWCSDPSRPVERS